jgi:hypothetical protein
MAQRKPPASSDKVDDDDDDSGFEAAGLEHTPEREENATFPSLEVEHVQRQLDTLRSASRTHCARPDTARDLVEQLCIPFDDHDLLQNLTPGQPCETLGITFGSLTMDTTAATAAAIAAAAAATAVAAVAVAAAAVTFAVVGNAAVVGPTSATTATAASTTLSLTAAAVGAMSAVAAVTTALFVVNVGVLASPRWIPIQNRAVEAELLTLGRWCTILEPTEVAASCSPPVAMGEASGEPVASGSSSRGHSSSRGQWIASAGSSVAYEIESRQYVTTARDDGIQQVRSGGLHFPTAREIREIRTSANGRLDAAKLVTSTPSQHEASASADAHEGVSVVLAVDPARLPQLSERVSALLGNHEDLDEDLGLNLGRELSTKLHSTQGSPVTAPHDDAWVRDVCEQIRRRRFATIRLPAAYIAVYQELLRPSSYPDPIRNTRGRSTVAPVELPAALTTLSAIWAIVCECVCTHVARELKRLVPTSLPPPRAEVAAAVTETAHGLLRITYNCTGGAHLDNSFVTLTGTGNVRGALEFAIEDEGAESGLAGGAEGGEAGRRFVACEDLLRAPREIAREIAREALPHEIAREIAREVLPHASTSLGAPVEPGSVFIIFIGVQLGGYHSPVYRPLMHRVVLRPAYSPCSSSDRINAIYFLKRFSPSSCSAAHCSAAPVRSSSEFQLIVQQQYMVHQQMTNAAWPPHGGSSASPAVGRAVRAVPDKPFSSDDEDGGEQAIVHFDWGADGLDAY